MSTLLDSLRRARYADTAAPHAPGAGRQVELILSTLGSMHGPGGGGGPCDSRSVSLPWPRSRCSAG